MKHLSIGQRVVIAVDNVDRASNIEGKIEHKVGGLNLPREKPRELTPVTYLVKTSTSMYSVPIACILVHENKYDID